MSKQETIDWGMGEISTAGFTVPRLRSAIKECDVYIAKEGPRDPALRPAWAQQALDHAIMHRHRLLDIMQNLHGISA